MDWGDREDREEGREGGAEYENWKCAKPSGKC